MKNRIRAILNYYNITQADFARRIGVTKGLISHIMADNGRGGQFRESTLDSIIGAFPDLNKDWLRDGVGSMLKNDPQNQGSLFEYQANASVSPEKKSQREPSLAPEPQSVTSEMPESPTPKSVDSSPAEKQTAPSASQPSQSSANVLHAEPSDDAATFAREAPLQYLRTPPQRDDIERIVIFYSDGTFTEHLPKK